MAACCFICISIFSLVLIFASYASQEGLYGLGDLYNPQNGNFSNFALFEYDAATGNGTLLQVPQPKYDSLGIQTGVASGCLDTVHNLYWLLFTAVGQPGAYTALYAYDLQNSSNKYDPIQLPVCADPYGDFAEGVSCAADANTGDLIVFGVVQSCYEQAMLLKVSIDPVNITKLATYGNIYTAIGSPSIFDSKRNMLWVLNSVYPNGELMKWYIDTQTGNLTKQIRCTDTADTVCMPPARYHPGLDLIVGIKQEEEKVPPFHKVITDKLFYADPVSFQITKEFSAIETAFPNAGSKFEYALDVYHNVFYAVFAEINAAENVYRAWLVGVNVTTGTTVSTSLLCPDYLDSCVQDIQYWKPS